MMALGAGVVVPNVLRWYWWRLNGWGYSVGTLSGMLLSLIALFFPEIPMYIFFPIVCLFSLLISIFISLMTEPVGLDHLTNFFVTVRPFGLWKPIKQLSGMPQNELIKKEESGKLALFNTFIGICAVTGLYLSPMFLVGHWYGRSLLWFIVFVISGVILKFTWYDNLPFPENNKK